ncbi:29771_t:CDS:2 [Racocetra persica]|uniref:29771_t:CDS:1 n=1 Tax=Racocetra persica TaxID=160502 RepID=A0ACA9Q9H4_9GLOM|nr:29771_t:CDS:2 [Racocetra persica]
MTSTGGTSQINKKVVSKDEWVKKLSDVKIDKADLNKLIMNYFVIEGYKDAAEAFSQECGLSPSIDVDSIQDRMNIRNAIQNGNVEEAIERVNDLNPEILDTNPKLYFHLQQQRLIEYIREGKITEALEFAQDELAPRGEENPEFLEELERTMALLAFDDTSVSPVGDLLHPSQRQRTASELNAAILTSQSQEKDPKLPSLLKMLVWAQDELDEKVLFPRMKNLVTAELIDTNDSATNNTTINNSFMST